MTTNVWFIDDDENERRGCVDVLREIFADTSISVEARPPLPALGDYATSLSREVPAALILDQRLNTSGQVVYTGAELAAHLRAIGTRVPIVILTNYPSDDFSAQEWAVECIFEKKSTLRDPVGPPAQAFKLRLSRQVAISSSLLAAREQRFHELLIKSSRERLSSDEENELRQLEGERMATVAAAERERQIRLDTDIEALKRLLGRDRLL